MSGAQAAVTKRCTKCGEVKSLEEFHRRSDAQDGRHARCRDCASAYNRELRLSKLTPEQLLERERRASITPEERRERRRAYDRRYNAEHREERREYARANRERGTERMRAWRAANPERDLANRLRYAEKNRERMIEQRRQYRLENPHKDWESDYRKRCRAAGQIPVVRSFTREELVEFWGNGERCIYCDGPFEEIDHLFPVSLGGAHSIETVAPSCSGCNHTGGQHATRFLRQMTEEERYVQVVVGAARARLAPIA